MKKHLQIPLLLVALLLTSIPISAHDFEVDGIYYNILDEVAKTVEVTYRGIYYDSYSNEYTGNVVIPDAVTYNDTTYSVTSIGTRAFSLCVSLKSATIGNSVTSIGDYAFSYCLISSITIPNSVASIGESAFRNSDLTVVNISDLSAWCKINFEGIYSNPLGDGAKIKLNGSEINNLVIPNDITEIKQYAFFGCDGLTSVTIPNSVTEIGESAFSGCEGLTSVTIPNSVTKIGGSAFYGTPWYNNMADGVIYISNVLYSYKGTMLENTSINIKEGTISISPSAFSDCEGLTSVTIPNSVTSIGRGAFCATGLTSITIPNSVTIIGQRVFYLCSGLVSITIGDSVTSIGEGAFEMCSGLKEVNISDLSAWCKIDFSDNYSNPLFYATKLNLNGSEIKDLVIPNDITEIKNCAFYGCNGLTSVTIPNSVTSIGDNAFDSRYNLKTIVSLNTTPPICASSSSFYSSSYLSSYTRATLYVPKDSYAKYFVDDVWGQFNNIKKIETLVSSIALNKTALTLNSGSDYTLKTSISPSSATIPNLTWESDNPTIATVDENGKVIGISEGTVTIIVKANDGSNVTATCKVTVNSATPAITLSQTEATLPVNEIMTLSYSITNSATQTATWSTSNGNVAYLKASSDGSATILGMADGVATITATMVDNGKEYSASCIVTVGVGGVELLEVDNNAVEVARYDIYGRLLSEPTKGINIVKMSDGTTRKECVK